MKPTPRSLVIDLLSAAAGKPVPVRELVRACAIFAIRETSVRVAVVRLSAAGTIESSGRGEYRLGKRAQSVAREVGGWRDVERRVRAWDGSFVFASVKGPADRGAARRRDRALHLVGLKALEPGLFARPDNLEGSVEAIRERLEALAIKATVFKATELSPADRQRLFKLWDTRALNAAYSRGRLRLAQWLEKADQLDPQDAARECFLLGGEAIRQIVYDPLLPDPFVDTLARRSFVDAMRNFDRVGRGIWSKVFGVRLGAPGTPEAGSPGWVH